MAEANPLFLAQLNIGRLRYPLEDVRMADFVNGLAHINALADASPGFLWRLQSDSGNATDVRVFDDEDLLVNLSVWESVDALRAYVYKSEHADFLRRRKEWFAPLDGPHQVLWWVKAGHIPPVEEAKARLERLAAEGPSPEVFTFRTLFESEQP